MKKLACPCGTAPRGGQGQIRDCSNILSARPAIIFTYHTHQQTTDNVSFYFSPLNAFYKWILTAFLDINKKDMYFITLKTISISKLFFCVMFLWWNGYLFLLHGDNKEKRDFQWAHSHAGTWRVSEDQEVMNFIWKRKMLRRMMLRGIKKRFQIVCRQLTICW